MALRCSTTKEACGCEGTKVKGEISPSLLLNWTTTCLIEGPLLGEADNGSEKLLT